MVPPAAQLTHSNTDNVQSLRAIHSQSSRPNTIDPEVSESEVLVNLSNCLIPAQENIFGILRQLLVSATVAYLIGKIDSAIDLKNQMVKFGINS